MNLRGFSRFGASLKLGSLLGIPIRLHFTFLLLIGWLVWMALRGGEEAMFGLMLILLLFACVMLHELGHAAMALLFGVRAREILLLPIGGWTRFERMPIGVAELLIALAGPAVNLALGLAFLIGGIYTGLPAIGATSLQGGEQSMVWLLALLNFALAFFNLLPAFPLDGARALRGFLTLFMPVETATAWVVRVGQGVAIVLVVSGLATSNPILVLLAFLAFIVGARESSLQRSRAQMQGRTAADAMITRYESLAPQDSLGNVAKLMLDSDQRVFPVIDAWGRVAGVVTRPILFEALATRGGGTAILEIMAREMPVGQRESPLEEVVEKLQNPQRLPLMVLDDSGLVGIVTSENLGEMVELSRVASDVRRSDD